MDKVEVGRQTKRPKKLWPAVWLVGLVVLALVAGGAVRWWQNDQAARRAAEPTAVQQQVADIQDLAVSGDYQAAHEATDKALANKYLSSQERYNLILQQGVTYENQKDYKAAIQAYQEAEALSSNQSIAEAIGRAADLDGDKQLAIAYYKKAITLIPKDDPVAGDYKQLYESIIKNLGGTP